MNSLIISYFNDRPVGRLTRRLAKAMVLHLFVTCMVVACAGMAGASVELPRMMLRLNSRNTFKPEQWTKALKSIAENPGCGDEVWFSTGIAFPKIEWHIEHARRLQAAAEDVRRLGIVPSLQIQATIGHGDHIAAHEDISGKTWGGFMGRGGVEAHTCNCPRQTAFLDYYRQLSAAYAKMKPSRVWIDDDLRVRNHSPAADFESVGCWCATCIAAFNGAEEQIIKCIEAAMGRRNLGNPGFVDLWCEETESWPRAYAARSGQNVLIEQMAAIACGMDSLSYFVTDPDREEDELYSRAILKPLAEAAPVLRAYLDDSRGTVPCGVTLPTSDAGAIYKFARIGIPVLPGWGRGTKSLQGSDMPFYIFDKPSTSSFRLNRCNS